MAKKLLMNKVNNVIDNYNRWLQVFEFSKSFNTINDSRIDDSKKIYIDEIWGNTWQDGDGKNLFDINSLQMVGENAHEGIIDIENNSITFNYENVRDYGCETNFIFEGGKKYKISADIDYRCDNKGTRFFCIDTAGRGFGYRDSIINFQIRPNFSERVSKITNVTIPDDGRQYVLYVNGTNYCDNVTGSTILKNIVIEEVDNETDTIKPTEYEPYHKGDLSNIQHVGELCVDEDGEPELDEQGRKQYKIEIDSSNNFNFAELFCKYGGFRNDDEYIYINKNENPDFEIDLDWDIKTPLTFHIGGEIIEATSGFEFGEFRFIYEDGDYISFYAKLTHDTVKDFKKKKLVKFKWRNPWGSVSKIKKSDFWICQGDVDDLDPKSHKQTILLPCQLMKVGDVKDRLYWDVDKGKYMVEKNVGKLLFTKTFNDFPNYDTEEMKGYKSSPYNNFLDDILGYGFCNKLKVMSYDEGIRRQNIIPMLCVRGVGVYIKQLVSICANKNELNKWIKDCYYLGKLETPELIETNITKRIELPCYNHITHILVNSGNIEPSNIKVVVPMKTSIVTDGLIGWYDARYRHSDDTYLIDRSNNGNDIPCKYSGEYVINNDFIDIRSAGYTEAIDYTKYINGEVTILYYIDTKNSSDVSNAGWFACQLKCMSGYYVNNLGQFIQPGTKYSNIWYKNKRYIHDSDSKLIYPRDKIMIAMTISLNKINIYVNGSICVSSNISAVDLKDLIIGLFGGSDKYPNTISYKYYSSYVYNHALTDEEIMQNYQYEQSIQRGGN